MELQKENSELKERIVSLENENSGLKSQMADLKSKNETFQENVKKQDSEILELKVNNEDLRSEVNNLRKEVSQCISLFSLKKDKGPPLVKKIKLNEPLTKDESQIMKIPGSHYEPRTRKNQGNVLITTEILLKEIIPIKEIENNPMSFDRKMSVESSLHEDSLQSMHFGRIQKEGSLANPKARPPSETKTPNPMILSAFESLLQCEATGLSSGVIDLIIRLHCIPKLGKRKDLKIYESSKWDMINTNECLPPDYGYEDQRAVLYPLYLKFDDKQYYFEEFEKMGSYCYY